jgi:hypothetical protein
VLNELAMMGYDKDGLCRKPTAVYLGGDPFDEPNPMANFDVPSIPMEDIAALKRKLEDLP